VIVTISACLTGSAEADISCGTDATIADALAAAGVPPREVWHGERRVAPHARIDSAEVGHAALLTALPDASAWGWNGPRLVSVAGPDAGHEVRVAGPAVLGCSTPGFRDASVSARHARVVPTATGARLLDLGSVNGLTRVESGRRGRTAGFARLANGDRVAVGRAVVEFRTDAPQRAPLAQGMLSRLGAAFWSRFATAATGRAHDHAHAAGPTAPDLTVPDLTVPDPTAPAERARARFLHLEPEARAARRTEPQWWGGGVMVSGPKALEAWRAVVLARGIAPSDARPDESWLRWLPNDASPACRLADGDAVDGGPVDGGPVDGGAALEARDEEWELRVGDSTVTLDPCHVSRAAAERLARAVARAGSPPTWPPRWADLCLEPSREGSTPAPMQVGVWSASGEPWIVPRRAWTLLAVGSTSRSRGALMEIIAGTSAWSEPPDMLRLFVVGDIERGALQRIARLDHVAVAATPREARTAFEAAAALARSGGRPLVIVDDADALARDAAEALDRLLLGGPGAPPCRAAVASSRSSGVYSAATLAAAEWLVALDDAEPQHASDLTGAASPGTSLSRGHAWVRHAGELREARIADAIATATPPAWPGRGDPPPGTWLCDAAIQRWRDEAATTPPGPRRPS